MKFINIFFVKKKKIRLIITDENWCSLNKNINEINIYKKQK